MTKIEKQKRLDAKKWQTSQEKGTDMNGKMSYCHYCSFRNETYDICVQMQDDRENLCSCAIAYEKMVKENKK